MRIARFTKSSLTLRIAVGKITGFIIGLMAFPILAWLAPQAPSMLAWAVLLWYTTLGAIIGVFGIYDRHPVLHLPLPWWFRAAFLGAWMNFLVTLFAYREFETLLTTVLAGSSVMLVSPFWFVAEGAVIGLLIGAIATRIGGEGPDTVHEVRRTA